MGKTVVSAPGKVILFGEHAVVHGMLGVAISVNLRTTLRIEDSDERCISVSLPSIGLKNMWSLEELSELNINPGSVDPEKPALVSEDDILTLKKFVGYKNNGNDLQALAQVVFLALYFSINQDNRKISGLNISASSELSVGGGLGSSAAYSACLVTGLLYHRGVLPFEKRAGMGDVCDWTPKELDLINRWAYLAETICHGNPSGIDNSVSTFGGILKFKHGKITPLEGNLDLKILLINTKVSRNTKMLVSVVQDKLTKYPDVVKPILEAIGSLSEKGCQIVSDVMNNIALPEHYTALEELVSINQSLLEALGVGHPKLNDICRIAAEFRFHAKLTGAGGGGFAFILIPPYADDNAVVEVTKKLTAHGFECWETTLGGPGLRSEPIHAEGDCIL